MKLTVVDLFCGLGGFSQAFRDRGHRVIGVDIVPPADVLADVKALPFNGKLKPDVVLGSPPCLEFTRTVFPWLKDKANPEAGMSLVRAMTAAVESLEPKWWVMENVRGSIPFIGSEYGRPIMSYHGRFLWGQFPLALMAQRKETPKKWTKQSLSSTRYRERAKIPYEISLRLCEAMERGT